VGASLWGVCWRGSWQTKHEYSDVPGHETREVAAQSAYEIAVRVQCAIKADWTSIFSVSRDKNHSSQTVQNA